MAQNWTKTNQIWLTVFFARSDLRQNFGKIGPQIIFLHSVERLRLKNAINRNKLILVEFLSKTLDIPRGFVCFLSSMMYGMNITSTLSGTSFFNQTFLQSNGCSVCGSYFAFLMDSSVQKPIINNQFLFCFEYIFRIY